MFLKNFPTCKTVGKTTLWEDPETICPFICKAIVTLGDSLEAGGCTGVMKNAEKHLVGNVGLKSSSYRDRGWVFPNTWALGKSVQGWDHLSGAELPEPLLISYLLQL